MSKRVALVCALLLAACGTRPPASDGGVIEDAGLDAGRPDSGTTPPDSGVPDAGPSCSDPLQRFNEDAGRCVLGPVLDIGACPAYRGVGCIVTFNRMSIGDSSTESIALFNTGEAPLTVQQPKITLVSGANSFSTPALGGPIVIAPGAFASVAVTFAPVGESLDIAELNLTSDSIFLSDRTIPIEGATTDAGCGSNSQCLLNERCELDAGHCSSCPQLTPPNCPGGNVVEVTNGMDCPAPVCKCAPGSVYRPGTGCVKATSCGSSCADGGACEDLCCSFPVCLCERDGGVCAG